MALLKSPTSLFTRRGADGHQSAQGWTCLPHSVRVELTAALAEFCGTFMFLFMAFTAAQVALFAGKGDETQVASLLYIASGFGCSLAINVWLFYRVSGGMFNPAVTLALLIVGAVKPVRALVVVITQLVAGICAAAVADCLVAGGALAVATTLGHGISPVQGLFIEVFLTAELVLAVFLLAVEKHRATFVAPVGIGLALFVAHLAGVYLTGASLNPARSLGPAILTGRFEHHWIYWVGPLLGSLLAFAVYQLLKKLRYEDVNPGQDSDDLELARSHTLQPQGIALNGRGDMNEQDIGVTDPKVEGSKRQVSHMEDGHGQ